MINYDHDRIRTVGEYLTAPSGRLHRDLYDLKQEVFPPQYRIVFSCFENIDEEVINNFIVELQKSLTFLDIPNYVVLFMSNRHVEHILRNAKQKHSYEVESIGFLYVNAPLVEFPYPITAILNPPESICAQPWVSIDINPAGEFKPCCFYKQALTDDNGVPFKSSKDSLDTVYHSKSMRRLREDFRQGKKPAHCSRCWKEEADNTISKRQLLKQRFKPNAYNANWEQDDISNLLFLSVAFGNICNLKCRICSSGSSSQIATEAIEHSDHYLDKKEHPAYKSLTAGMWIKDDTATIWDDLLNPNLNFIHVDLSGGEPMLSSKHFKVLQQLVDAGRAKDISIHYNTNGTVFPIRHIDLLKQFKEIDIALSIDNIDTRFEYERPGVTWDTVNANINQYLELKLENIKISLHLTINIQNVYYLPEICDWIQSKQFDSVHFSTLYDPPMLNISNVTSDARNLILQKLVSYQQYSKAATTSKFITNTINILKSATLSDGKEFCQYMQRLDSIRNENFTDTHTEIAIAMGYDRASTN